MPTPTPKTCKTCGSEISKERLLAMPTTEYCVDCRREEDVEKTIGIMSWEHKTAPHIITSAEVGEEAVRKQLHLQRRGIRPIYTFTPKTNAVVSSAPPVQGTAEFDSIRTTESEDESLLPWPSNTLVASCHPLRARVTPDGKCLDCAIAYYTLRAKWKGKGK